MKIKMNMTSNFKLVPEGERELTITKAECKPSGKPNRIDVTFQDAEGGFINRNYAFDNDKAMFALAKLLEVALKFEDGDEFDTKEHPQQLIGKKLICEVTHTQGTQPNENGEVPSFANIKKTISLVEENTDSPRNAIANQSDDDDDDL